MSNGIKAAYHILSNDADVTSVVSDRIYTLVADQGAAAPFIVLAGVGRVESPTQDADSAVDRYRIQVDAFAEVNTSSSPLQVLTTLEQYIRAALSRYMGMANGVHVSGSQAAGEGDEYDPELRLYRKRLDFIISTK